MSAVYAFLISVFVYKDMKIANTPKVLVNSAALSAMLLYIITNAVLFSFLMAHESIPQLMQTGFLAKNWARLASCSLPISCCYWRGM